MPRRRTTPGRPRPIHLILLPPSGAPITVWRAAFLLVTDKEIDKLVNTLMVKVGNYEPVPAYQSAQLTLQEINAELHRRDSLFMAQLDGDRIRAVARHVGQ